jgi:hypothetical protein
MEFNLDSFKIKIIETAEHITFYIYNRAGTYLLKKETYDKKKLLYENS